MDVVFEREVFLLHENSCNAVRAFLDTASTEKVNYIAAGIVNVLMPLAETESELEQLFDDIYTQGLMSEEHNVLRSFGLDDHKLYVTLSTGYELDTLVDRKSLLT